MSTRKRPVVGLAVETATGYGREVLHGFMRYANVLRQWVLLEDFQGYLKNPSDWPSCDGVLIAGRPAGFVERFCGHAAHIVSCSAGTDPRLVPVVCMDDQAIGRMAAEHLIDCGLKHFAFYCRGQIYPLAERRLRGFRETLDGQGFRCERFACQDTSTIASELNWAARPNWLALAGWIRGLPKPVGIFATDDTEARELAAVCLDADIPVPDDVALIGVNNDQLLCDSAFPALSSVQTNFEQVGFAAARVLQRLLDGKTLAAEERRTVLPPVGVVRRTSTDVLAVDDPALADALRYIREHATVPCSVDDVARHAAVTRRWLERRFSEKLGRSPHQEITHVRMEAARRLLTQPELPLPEVAERCGFSTVQSFHRNFRQATGESPAAWRRSHRRGGN
jgi:LacI family transcriptional regulator